MTDNRPPIIRAGYREVDGTGVYVYPDCAIGVVRRDGINGIAAAQAIAEDVAGVAVEFAGWNDTNTFWTGPFAVIGVAGIVRYPERNATR